LATIFGEWKMGVQSKQSKFVLMVRDLITFADNLGYEITFGETYVPLHRCPFCGEKISKHIVDSCHYHKLAIDINLFKDGEYLTETRLHLPLGEFWESKGGTWGGRFGESSPGAGDGVDGSHFSIEHNGVR